MPIVHSQARKPNGSRLDQHCDVAVVVFEISCSSHGVLRIFVTMRCAPGAILTAVARIQWTTPLLAASASWGASTASTSGCVTTCTSFGRICFARRDRKVIVMIYPERLWLTFVSIPSQPCLPFAFVFAYLGITAADIPPPYRKQYCMSQDSLSWTCVVCRWT